MKYINTLKMSKKNKELKNDEWSQPKNISQTPPPN